jgi:hypothetical protein
MFVIGCFETHLRQFSTKIWIQNNVCRLPLPHGVSLAAARAGQKSARTALWWWAKHCWVQWNGTHKLH